MKKYGLACCILPVLACLFLILLWAAPKILPRSTRHQYVDLHDLLIDTSPFPQGWHVDMEAYKDVSSELSWGEDNLAIGFSRGAGPGYAHQYVYRFRNPLSAVYGQIRIKQQGYIYLKSGTYPKEWSYRGEKADDWQIACNDYGCTAMARYGEFVSVFRKNTSPEYMTLIDLEKILRAIDDQIGRQLNR